MSPKTADYVDGIARRIAAVFSRFTTIAAVCLIVLAPACKKERTYDDAPIARDDRPHATKKSEPKIDYDREQVCDRLATVTSTKTLDEDEQGALREGCLRNLEVLKAKDRTQFDCRCKCIMLAPDIGAIELCQRRCSLDDLDAVCAHAVGSQEKSDNGTVIDEAKKVCIEKLSRLQKKDAPRYDCTLRCLMLANGKDESLQCDARCDPKNADNPSMFDAATDAPAPPKPPPLPTEMPTDP